MGNTTHNKEYPIKQILVWIFSAVSTTPSVVFARSTPSVGAPTLTCFHLNEIDSIFRFIYTIKRNSIVFPDIRVKKTFGPILLQHQFISLVENRCRVLVLNIASMHSSLRSIPIIRGKAPHLRFITLSFAFF